MAEVATEPAWLEERRQQGASLAQSLPLPDQKSKGWEFTDLSGLDIDAYEPSRRRGRGRAAPRARPWSRSPTASTPTPSCSRSASGSLVPVEDPFVARNEAGWSDGVLVHVPRGVRVAEPIRIEVPVDRDGAAVGWRTLIVLEEGAEAEVWEHWSSPGDEVDGLLNSVVELSVGQAATLRYVNTQDISEQAWIFATQRAQVERDGRLDWAALGFGSARGKVRMETKLAGPGSEARVTGGYAGGPGQHLDYDTHPGARGAEHQLRPRLPRRPRRRLDRGLARDDQGRPRRPADRRLPGEPQPAALDRGPRRRDPGPGDPRRRRPLHPRRGDRPDRQGAALLPDLARARPGRRRSR